MACLPCDITQAVVFAPDIAYQSRTFTKGCRYIYLIMVSIVFAISDLEMACLQCDISHNHRLAIVSQSVSLSASGIVYVVAGVSAVADSDSYLFIVSTVTYFDKFHNY